MVVGIGVLARRVTVGRGQFGTSVQRAVAAAHSLGRLPYFIFYRAILRATLQARET